MELSQQLHHNQSNKESIIMADRVKNYPEVITIEKFTQLWRGFSGASDYDGIGSQAIFFKYPQGKIEKTK